MKLRNFFMLVMKKLGKKGFVDDFISRVGVNIMGLEEADEVLDLIIDIIRNDPDDFNTEKEKVQAKRYVRRCIDRFDELSEKMKGDDE